MKRDHQCVGEIVHIQAYGDKSRRKLARKCLVQCLDLFDAMSRPVYCNVSVRLMRCLGHSRSRNIHLYD